MGVVLQSYVAGMRRPEIEIQITMTPDGEAAMDWGLGMSVPRRSIVHSILRDSLRTLATKLKAEVGDTRIRMPGNRPLFGVTISRYEDGTLELTRDGLGNQPEETMMVLVLLKRAAETMGAQLLGQIDAETGHEPVLYKGAA